MGLYKGQTNSGSFKKGNPPPTAFKKGHSLWGEKSAAWKGGRYIKDGYVFILSPNHPHRSQIGYVREHRLVMETHIGRILLPTEIVHHINGIRNDNRIENLMLHSSNREHIRGHNKSGFHWDNEEAVKKYKKEYNKNNKEKMAKYNKNYYNTKLKNEGEARNNL